MAPPSLIFHSLVCWRTLAAHFRSWAFRHFSMRLSRYSMVPNLSLNPDASPAALTRRPFAAG